MLSRLCCGLDRDSRTGSAVDALMDHFLNFTHDERTLPVIWHQSLLTLVQRCAARPNQTNQSPITPQLLPSANGHCMPMRF